MMVWLIWFMMSSVNDDYWLIIGQSLEDTLATIYHWLIALSNDGQWRRLRVIHQ